MAGSSAKAESRYHARSISLPSRSHPSTLRIDEELNKLKTGEILSISNKKAETIQVGLSGLGELYKCVEELLQLPLTQQALAQHQHEKWVCEVLDGSVRLLDVCSTIRDILLQMKECVRDLQSSLRRRRGEESSIDYCIFAYICARKKMRRDIVKCLEALKRMDNKFQPSPLLGLEHHLSAIVRVLREVCAITISIFQSLLSFVSTKISKPKPSGWSLVSKLMHKGLVASTRGEENLNEVESVDVTLYRLREHISSKAVDVERVQIAQRRLETLETSIKSLEEGSECMFRRLIQTRVSLLNILTS